MVNCANREIRQRIFESGVRNWEVAERIGVHEASFSRMLRHELPDDRKQVILTAIDEIQAKRDE